MSKMPKWRVLSHGYRWECVVNDTTIRVDRVGRTTVWKKRYEKVYRDDGAY